MMLDLTKVEPIETERLVLRLPSEDDFEPFAQMYADEEVMRFIGGPVDRDLAWRTLATIIGHWVMRGYGLYSVIEKDTGKFAGRVGLIYPEAWPALEIGWVIARPCWNKGYATEAARAILNVWVPKLNPKRLISLIADENESSIAVAGKLNALNVGKTEFNGFPTFIFAYSLPASPIAGIEPIGTKN